MIKSLLNGGAAAALVVALAVPAWSQTSPTQGPSTQQNGPATAGNSHPGVPGLPGNKSGASVTPSGTTAPETGPSHPSSDQSGVKGLPGSKSGTTVKPSDKSR
jgi:hypothetical protein